MKISLRIYHKSSVCNIRRSIAHSKHIHQNCFYVSFFVSEQSARMEIRKLKTSPGLDVLYSFDVSLWTKRFDSKMFLCEQQSILLDVSEGFWYFPIDCDVFSKYKTKRKIKELPETNQK